MYDAILELIRSLFNHGISWGSLIAFLIFLNRLQRANQYKLWNSDVSHNLKILMELWGVGDQWRGQVGISKNEEVQNLKKLYSSLQVAINQVYPQRRNRTMIKALTSSISKKLIAFLVAAAVTALNSKLGLNLNADSIYGIIGLAIAYIAGQSHVDAKKAISNAVNAVSTAVVESAATTDGSPITTVVAPPMSYEDMLPYITEVHADINKIFEQVKSGKYTDSTQQAINAYMTLHDYFTKNKEVDHAATESK
jgi:hypothetical protein